MAPSTAATASVRLAAITRARSTRAGLRLLRRGIATVLGPRPLAPSTFSRYVNEPRCVRVVGAPLADGQPLLGVDRGPTFIRNHGLVERLVRA